MILESKELELCKSKSEVFNSLYEYSKHPEPFTAGTGNNWIEPHLASQMLEAHLNQDIDAASRKEQTSST